MSEEVLFPEQAPLLSPLERVVNTFIAPSKTFVDVKRSSGWWVPFLIAAVVGVVYAYALLHKIGLPALVDGAIRQSSIVQRQLESATPEQAAQIHARIEGQFKYSYIAPVFSLLVGLISAGVLLGTATFVAGGKASFAQMLGVWFYGSLPLLVFYLLTIAAIYGGAASDPYNMKNPIGTNIGFYLGDAEIPKPLIALLSAVDIFAIWTAVLVTIGVSTVAGIKRGAAAAVVFGWWFVFVLIQAGLAAIGG